MAGEGEARVLGADIRDVLAAVAFLFSDRLPQDAYEALADADVDLMERVERLVAYRREGAPDG